MHWAKAGDQRCQNCAGPLKTRRELRERYCSRIQCLGPKLQEMARNAREREAKERAARASHTEEVREFLATQPELETHQVDAGLLIVVPSLQSKIVKQPQQRIDEFQTNLEEAALHAESKIKTEVEREMLRNISYDDTAEESPNHVINSCITCRGVCCLQGAGHAFLKRDEIARRLVLEPEQTPEIIVDDYLSRIPEYAYENSCVFHGEQGCVLPRNIRSSTCNSFLCTGIVDVVQTHASISTAPTLVAALDGQNCTRVAHMTPQGTRTEVELNRSLPD